MAKAFVELLMNKRIYKLNVQDMARLHKILKRKTPSLPAFENKEKLFNDTED